LLLGAIVPLIAIFWYSAANAGHQPTYYPPTHTSPPYAEPDTTSTFDTAHHDPSKTTNTPPIVNRCILRPANGAVLNPSFFPAAYGHSLTIQNGSEGDAIVKLRNAYTRKLVASFFVRRGMTASLDGISDGDYRVQFAFGNAMNADCRSFAVPNASEFDGIQHFQSRTEGDQVIAQELSFTLYRVPNGNVTPNSISASDFDAD
jgi:hypothetical protein